MTVASGGAKVGKGAQEFILEIVLLDAHLISAQRSRSEAGYSLGIGGNLRTRLLYLDVSGHLCGFANNLVCVHDEPMHRL